MTSNHTPGPWYFHGGAVYLHPFPDTSVCIANPDRSEPATAPWERDANARLISEAPAMLAALKGCADALKEAGKSFALNNPLAARPNLFEIHEAEARTILDRIEGRM